MLKPVTKGHHQNGFQCASFAVGTVATALTIVVLIAMTPPLRQHFFGAAQCPMARDAHPHALDGKQAEMHAGTQQAHTEALLAALAMRQGEYAHAGVRRIAEEPPTAGLLPRRETDDELHARPFHEHVPTFTTQPILQPRTAWHDRIPSRPYQRREREGKCANDEATKLNLRALKAARDAFDHPVAYPADLEDAKGLYRLALQHDPECATARLSLIMLETNDASYEAEPNPTAAWHEIVGRLAKMESIAKGNAKYWFWRSVVVELMGNGTQHSARFFTRATELDPELRHEHLHPTNQHASGVLGAYRNVASFYLRKAFVQWLTYYEFAPYFGGYPKVTYEDTQRFARDWHIAIPHAMSNYCHNVVARVYQFLIDGHYMDHTTRPDTASHESPGDVMNTWNNIRLREFVERLSGIPVEPTYGYTAGYKPGNVLRPHTDRDPCEFTLTYLLWSYPNAAFCPLFVQKTPWKVDAKWLGRFEDDTMHYDDVLNTRRQVGMLVVLRGRAKPHFTPKIAPGVSCTTLLSHFVPAGQRIVS